MALNQQVLHCTSAFDDRDFAVAVRGLPFLVVLGVIVVVVRRVRILVLVLLIFGAVAFIGMPRMGGGGRRQCRGRL